MIKQQKYSVESSAHVPEGKARFTQATAKARDASVSTDDCFISREMYQCMHFAQETGMVGDESKYAANHLAHIPSRGKDRDFSSSPSVDNSFSLSQSPPIMAALPNSRGSTSQLQTRHKLTTRTLNSWPIRYKSSYSSDPTAFSRAWALRLFMNAGGDWNDIEDASMNRKTHTIKARAQVENGKFSSTTCWHIETVLSKKGCGEYLCMS